MTKENAKALLLKYQSGSASEEEKAIVEDWMLHGAADDFNLSDKELVQDLTDIRQRLERDAPFVKIGHLWLRIATAASIILCLSAGSYFLLHKTQLSQQAAQNQIHDIVPGGNKAILTLSNGKKISLTDAKSGILVNQGKTAINKTGDGEVAYQADQKASETATTYNMISTPRGGKWTVSLPDHSIAWLDAASSIRFPVAFNGNKRIVEITGQVYFEVVHNASKSFKVIVIGQTIEDIGTHFNINAYNDEPVIKTTLIEGGISLTTGKEKVILRPGQQAITQPNINTIQVKDVDTEEAIAWKNGYFLFDNENLESVMRKISRWYDMDIEYPKGKQVIENYWGSITRFDNVSKVLKMLEVTGNVRFKVEGKKIIVLKK